MLPTFFVRLNESGTSPLQRYKLLLDQANLREQFYDPNLPGTTGIIGNDTQLWRYDFFPSYLAAGFSAAEMSPPPADLAAFTGWGLTALVSDQQQYHFGWKTSTNHSNDDGVSGHLIDGNPLKDWRELHDPRSGQSLDLSYALRAFPVTGINKDLKNTTTATATGVQIILAGPQVIIWHYDDAPAWPTFTETTVAGNTVLTWTGKTVPPGGLTHVGFEMAGSGAPPIIGINWLTPTGVTPTRQLCFHFRKRLDTCRS